MSSDNDLRYYLDNVNGSAPAIQNAASAMMKQYDRNAELAVNNWNNSLKQNSTDKSQLLPLLYVANEVIQNSKRNRGNKFLEAFSPILGSALEYMCSCDPAITEKVRRTVKIWADRRVFSIRYVNELLKGLEQYREGRRGGGGSGGNPPPQQASIDGAHFSPPPSPKSQSLESQSTTTTTTTSNKIEKHDTPDNKTDDDNDNNNNSDNSDDDDDDIMAILEEDRGGGGNKDGDSSNDDDDDDDDNLFADNAGEGARLELDINLESTLATRASSGGTPSKAKRRRSSTGSTTSSSHHSGKRRKSQLTTNNFVNVFNRLIALQSSFEHSQACLKTIDDHITKISPTELQNLVGDELQHAYKQNTNYQKQIMTQRANLYDIAQERHNLEKEAIRYLPWIEQQLEQDTDDITFCDTLRDKILSFSKIHDSVRTARDIRVAEDQKRQLQQEEMDRKRREQEENEKFRQAALAKETEAKPGMVWNPSTREYQSLNTEESWRD